MKTCIKCLSNKKLNEFDTGRNTCRICRNLQRKNRPKKFYEISVKEKNCRICKITKLSEDFPRNIRRSDGLHYCCLVCHNNNQKLNYQRNPQKGIERSKRNYLKLRGTEEFKIKRRQKYKEKIKNPHYVLSRRLRNRLYYALRKKSWKKNTKFSDYIGCTLEELKLHIEKQFTEGMTWDNQGKWHIDHIIPLNSANTEEELYKLCHYTNLQPMWAKDNIRKGCKI